MNAAALTRSQGSKILLIAALLLAVYADTLRSLAYDWWNDPGASYGFLMPPLAVYAAWLYRGKTLARPAEEDRRGLVLVLFGCLLFLVGKLGAEFFLARFSLVLVLGGLSWTFWGYPRTRTLAFPFILLATMIPLPALLYNQMSVPLQLFASEVATRILQAAGLSVFRDGNILELPNTTLGVAEACSGLHSLASLAAGAMLLGSVECKRISARVALVAVAVPVAILVNVLRVTGTAFLTQIDQKYADGFYHGFAGWFIFVAGFGILYLLAKLLSLSDPRPASQKIVQVRSEAVR